MADTSGLVNGLAPGGYPAAAAAAAAAAADELEPTDDDDDVGGVRLPLLPTDVAPSMEGGNIGVRDPDPNGGLRLEPRRPGPPNDGGNWKDVDTGGYILAGPAIAISPSRNRGSLNAPNEVAK